MSLYSLILITVTFTQLSSHGQNVTSKIDSLERRDEFFQYEDKQKKRYYSQGLIEQIYPKVFFRTVYLDKKTKVITLEGITTNFIDPDTIRGGQCCFDLLVGQEDNKDTGTLKNVRYFRESNDKEKGDTSKPEGYFNLKFKLSPNDVLIIGTPGGAGSGAVAYFIGSLLKLE